MSNKRKVPIEIKALAMRTGRRETVLRDWSYYVRSIKPLQPCVTEFKDKYGYALERC